MRVLKESMNFIRAVSQLAESTMATFLVKNGTRKRNNINDGTETVIGAEERGKVGRGRKEGKEFHSLQA